MLTSGILYLRVTTVTCLKHPWSVRLYDPQKMEFVKVVRNGKSRVRFRRAPVRLIKRRCMP